MLQNQVIMTSLSQQHQQTLLTEAKQSRRLALLRAARRNEAKR